MILHQKLHFVVVVVVEFVLVQMMNNCYQFGSFLLVHFYLEREHLMGIELELPSLNELTKGKRYDIPLKLAKFIKIAIEKCDW